MPCFFLIIAILFGLSNGALTEPLWMYYRTALFMLYATTHIFICTLHYQMGLADRVNSEAHKLSSTLSRVKTVILSLIIYAVSITAFVILLLEN